MDSNDKKLKKLLSEDNSLVPPELSWERMEEGILQKMEELQSEKSIAANRRKRFQQGFIVAALLILLLCLYLCSRSKQENIQAVIGKTKIEYAQAADNQSEKNVNAQSPNASENSDCNEPIANDNVNGNLTVVKFAKKKQQRLLDHSWPLNADNSLLLNIESTSVEESNNTPLSSDQGAKHSIIEGEKDYFDSPIASIATLKPRLVQEREESASHLPELVQLASLYKPTPKASTSSTNRIALMSGVTQWTMGYGSKKPERASHEQNIISFQAQLNYIHRLKKDYTLMIGLQFQQLETRFDWSTALDDYTVILKDTIIQVRTNLLTGQQTEVRGDIEVNVPAVRTVRHYNRVQLYQIPIAVGKTWKIRNWQADLMAGTAVNILSENQGRTLYQGELQYYQGTSTRFIENQWAIHGLLMGRVTYQVNDYFGLSAGFQFQKSITNWSAEPDIRMHPNFFSGELGISFMLD